MKLRKDSFVPTGCKQWADTKMGVGVSTRPLYCGETPKGFMTLVAWAHDGPHQVLMTRQAARRVAWRLLWGSLRRSYR